MEEKEMEELLNKTKKLEFIPGCKGKYMDVNMLADYYEVSDNTIMTIRKRNINELYERNLLLIRRKDIDIYFDLKKYTILKPYNSITILKYNSNFDFKITNSGKYLFPIKCIFYIGLILKDSSISKKIKKNLNKFETIYIERRELSFLRKLE